MVGGLVAAAKKAWVPGFAGMSGLVLAACTPATPELPPALPKAPVQAGPAITIQATPVEFDPKDPAKKSFGAFTWAGGVELTSNETSRLHGLSDIKIWPDGRVLVVGDQGDLLQARLVFDYAGHLTGLKEAKLTSVIGEDGQPITSHGQSEWASEGIAEFPNGDRLISLEQHDRILFYPHAGGPPRPAPLPDVKFVFNQGMEALAVYPKAGRDAYVVGLESTGETFVCRLSAACIKDRTVELKDGYGLAGLEILSGGRTAYLLRAFDPLRGVRISLRIVGVDGQVEDQLELARPYTIDNFEGVAAAPSPSGGLRFYLISDDNFSKSQRTLLVAFDWRPGSGS
jgi:hypothetical protein